MDEKIVQEILHELFSSLETLDTQSAAIVQFLKDKGMASEEDLAPYFEQAGNASSVRWRAVRVRIDYLISSAISAAERDAQTETRKAVQNKPVENLEEARNPGTEKRSQESEKKESEKNDQGATQPVASSNKAEPNDVSVSSEPNRKLQAGDSDANKEAGTSKDSKLTNEADRAGENTEMNAA